MPSPKELSEMLRVRAEEAVRYLYPGDVGKFINGRFAIGDIHGAPGESFVIYLDSGRFKDMSDTTQYGDLLQLFQNKYGSKQSGYDHVYSFLGIQKPIIINGSNGNGSGGINGDGKPKTSKKKWTPPPTDEYSQLTETESPRVFSYLTEKRKLSINYIPLDEVKQTDDRSYVFLTYTHGLDSNERRVCGAVSISLKRRIIVRDGETTKKKIITQANNPLSVLWGHPSAEYSRVLNKKGRKGKLIITAGQIDCLSLRCQGIMNSVSVPFGENDTGWVENSWDWMMEHYDEFLLFFDNDPTGEDYTETIASKIGYARCKKCYLPAKYKDINEAHVDGFQLTESIEKAADFKMDTLVSAADLIEETMAILKLGRREDIGIPFLGWEGDLSVKFRIRPREFTIVTGYGGHGKSNCLYQMIAYMIFKHKQRIVLASLEENKEVINSIIAQHALGMIYDPLNTDNNHNIDLAFRAVCQTIGEYLYIYNHRGTANFKEMLATFEFAIRKYGADHAIIDSVAKTDLNIEKNEEARYFVSAVSDSVNQTGAHYWLVAHSHKGDDRDYKFIPGYQQIKGDNAFGVQCFNCITIWRNNFRDILDAKNEESGGTGYKPKKKRWNNNSSNHSHKGGIRDANDGEDDGYMSPEEIKNTNHVTLYISKQRVGGQLGQFKLFFNHDAKRLHRSSAFTDNPYYADEIYEKYILYPEDYVRREYTDTQLTESPDNIHEAEIQAQAQAEGESEYDGDDYSDEDDEGF